MEKKFRKELASINKEEGTKYKKLVITYNAEKNRTHILVDGKEIGNGCRHVRFEHEAGRLATISIDTTAKHLLAKD